MRATADLDLAVGLMPDNARRAMQTLAAIGLQPRMALAIEDFADVEKRREWLHERNMLVFSLRDPGNPLRSVDVFIDEPVAFAELLRDAVTQDLGGTVVRIASIDHLIVMKQAAARKRDLDDIDKLRQIRDAETGSSS